MKFKKWLYSSFVAVAAMFMVAQNASAASAGYGSSTVAPTIYTKNNWYYSAYPVVGSPPSNAKVTIVNYNWSYSYPRPSGLQVWLCANNGGVCFDVTSFGSGSRDFTPYNISATQPLRLYARVQGTGTMSPLWGSTSNIAVNYVY